MEWLDRVLRIREDAEGLNLNLYKICVRAKVPYSTVARWINRETAPRVDTLDDFCTRMEAAVRQARIEIMQEIARKVA